MPNPSLVLWVDSANNRLLSGWQSLTNATTPSLKQGDNVGVEIHWVSAYSGGVMSEIPFPSTVNMTLAVGVIDTAPSAGSYILSYGGQSVGIPYNAQSPDIQTALNSLSTITADGGVTVSEIGNLIRILWNNAGVMSNTITVSSNDLFPTCSIGISTIRTGASNVKQIVQLHVKQSPVAMCNTFVAQDQATVSVSVVHTPAFTGDMKVWRVTISPNPRSGTFLISWQDGSNTYRTTPIPVTANASVVLNALTTAKDDGWYVTQTGQFSWDISTSNTAPFNMVVSGAGIISFNSMYGVLNMNTAEVEDLLNGKSSVSASLELQLNVSSTISTLFQSNCTVVNDLIDNDLYTIVQLADVMPVDSVVRYDTSQSLTTPQQVQARANIGAISQADATATITTKDVELEGRVATLEGLEISSDQKAAITGASSPSATNVFVTQSVLTSATNGFLTTSSAIPQSQITGLTTALAGFASVTQTWSISSITGLSAQLAQYALTTDLANISSTTIGTLTIGSTLVLPSSVIQANSQSGSFTNGIYTNEIIISVNGTNYAIPCRPA